MKIVDGKLLGKSVIEALRRQPRPERYLALLVVGDDAATRSFVAQKKKVAETVGVEIREDIVDASVSTATVRERVEAMGEDPLCGGIVVQLPLPAHVDTQTVLDAIPAEKDVDVLGKEAKQKLNNRTLPIVPPAVATVESILSVAGKSDYRDLVMAVVGSEGRLVGAPVAEFFADKVRKLIRIEKGDDIAAGLANADSIVSGAGVKGLLRCSMIRDGAVVIDFGYGSDANGVGGDFSAEEAEKKEGLYTPTPGGTGPVLVAHLFANFYTLNQSKQ